MVEKLLLFVGVTALPLVLSMIPPDTATVPVPSAVLLLMFIRPALTVVTPL